MSDERERQRTREINSLRFGWHERLIGDRPLHKHSGALAFAGLVLHRFQSALGWAEISIEYAAKRLNMPVSTVRRGRDLLIERGWLVRMPEQRARKGKYWSEPARYRLSGGPEDLALEAHGDVIGDTPGEVPPATEGECHW